MLVDGLERDGHGGVPQVARSHEKERDVEREHRLVRLAAGHQAIHGLVEPEGEERGHEDEVHAAEPCEQGLERPNEHGSSVRPLDGIKHSDGEGRGSTLQVRGENSSGRLSLPDQRLDEVFTTERSMVANS